MRSYFRRSLTIFLFFSFGHLKGRNIRWWNKETAAPGEEKKIGHNYFKSSCERRLIALENFFHLGSTFFFVVLVLHEKKCSS
jgi:hypothetical protein